MASTVDVVSHVSDLTAEWLSAVLSEPVTGFTSNRIGTGQVSECYRLQLEYASSTSKGPRTLVLKVAASDPTSRQSGLALGIYEREVQFYLQAAPKLGGTSLAPCYYAAFKDDFFSILLGDAAPAIVGDDIAGATIEQARLAISELGRLHAPEIRNKSLEGASWLAGASRMNQAILQQLFAGWVQRYKDRVSDAHLAVCQRLVGAFDAHIKLQSNTKVKGLVHGDYRLDNLLFGQEGSDRPLTVVDWQTIFYGSPLSDVAYFMGCSLPIETRRKHQEELVECYYLALGPDPPLTLEECKQGIRAQSFFGVVMGICSPMLVGQTDRGDTMFMVMMERHCTQVLDLNALDVLPQATNLEPLRPKPEDEHPHAKTEDPLWNESWYFDAVDKKAGIGAYVRLGLTPNQKGSWYTAVVTLPGQGCVLVADYQAPHPGDDLVLKTDALHATQKVLDPLKDYQVSLNGSGESFSDPAAILRGESGKKVKVAMDLTWKTDGEPYQWRLTPRYEIPCAVSGSVTVDGQAIDFNSAQGQRDHSWGSRDWWGADWMWCAFHFDDGTRIHGADLRIPGRPRMSVGYIQGPNQALTELAKCLSDEQMAADGLPAAASVEIESAAGDGFVVKLLPGGHGPLRLVAEDGRVAHFTRAWVKLQVSDGREGVGWVEWNHNKK